MLTKNERMETLKNCGVDTSKYFTLVVNNDIPAGSRINVSVENAMDAVMEPEIMKSLKAEFDTCVENEIAKRIVEDGYVRNTKLHRRWVAAQYMRMLEHPLGWHGYLNTFYDYSYQFKMMIEEVRVLSKLETRDRETFIERRRFFDGDTVIMVLNDYLKDVKTYIDSLKIRHCKGRPYVRIAGYGDIFTDEIDKKIIHPIEAMIMVCEKSYTYGKLYNSLVAFKEVMIKLPAETRKSKAWVDAFQAEGAFYTLKNLIMFHDVKLYYNGNFYNMYDGMEMLNYLVPRYEGYQMNALLKETIKRNNFNFKKSIEAHK